MNFLYFFSEYEGIVMEHDWSSAKELPELDNPFFE